MDDFMPKYDGVLEQWKVDLIAERAKRMGFGRHDVPDLMQRLAMILRRFKYDPENANGAQESTVVQALIDKHLLFVRRTAARYQEKVEFASARTEPMCDAENEHLALDVRQVVETLSEWEQAVCRELMAGCSLAETSKRLGCSWHTIKESVDQIVVAFKAKGANRWLER
jgi:DNA-directed RNA polymerase specialized sigma24 family protein